LPHRVISKEMLVAIRAAAQKGGFVASSSATQRCTQRYLQHSGASSWGTEDTMSTDDKWSG
jgi:hypothetical protein